MTITTTDGDILQVKLGIMCHQVNCMGKMGAGIALKIRKKWPIVYKDYMDAYEEGKLHLGEVILSTIQPAELYVANLCGQYYYGRDKKQTDYNAVRECLIKVNSMAHEKGLEVYIPKNMGCALAGGNWNVVSKIIEEVFSDVIIVDYGK
jgi:O-acetyl-ADP-ribose deacetylase (regulator of RNase III)